MGWTWSLLILIIAIGLTGLSQISFHSGSSGLSWNSLVQTQEIPKVKYDAAKDWLLQLVNERSPVIVTDSVVGRLSALKKWTPSYVGAHSGMLSRVRISNVKTFTHYNAGASVLQLQLRAEAVLGGGHGRTWRPAYNYTTLSGLDFMKRCSSYDVDENRFVLYTNPLSYLQHTELYRDVEPDILVAYTLPHRQPDITAWFGCGDELTSTAHYDAVDNFFLQVYGEKEFILFPPTDHVALALFPALHPNSFKTQIDFDAVQEKFRKSLSTAHAFTARLKPGDVLYLPPYWIHHVRALNRASFSLSLWTDAAECDIVDEAEAIALPFETHWAPAFLTSAAILYLSAVLSRSLVASNVTPIQLITDLRESRYAQYHASAQDEELIMSARVMGDARHHSPSYRCCGKHCLDSELFAKFSERADSVAPIYARLRVGVREMKLMDYVERVLGWVVGTERSIAPLLDIWLHDCVVAFNILN